MDYCLTTLTLSFFFLFFRDQEKIVLFLLLWTIVWHYFFYFRGQEKIVLLLWTIDWHYYFFILGAKRRLSCSCCYGPLFDVIFFFIFRGQEKIVLFFLNHQHNVYGLTNGVNQTKIVPMVRKIASFCEN